MKGKDAISRASLDSQRALPSAEKAKDKPVKTGVPEKQEAVMTGARRIQVNNMWFKAAGLGKMTIFFVFCILCAVRHWPLVLPASVGRGSTATPFQGLGQLADRLHLLDADERHLPCYRLLDSSRKLCGVSGNKLHAAQLRGVLSAPISFFNKWSAGQITNRFSQDLIQRRLHLQQCVPEHGGYRVGLLGALITMIIPAPNLLFSQLDCLPFRGGCRGSTSRPSRQLRRLEMAAKSPPLLALSETSSPVRSGDGARSSNARLLCWNSTHSRLTSRRRRTTICSWCVACCRHGSWR